MVCGGSGVEGQPRRGITAVPAPYPAILRSRSVLQGVGRFDRTWLVNGSGNPDIAPDRYRKVGLAAVCRSKFLLARHAFPHPRLVKSIPVLPDSISLSNLAKRYTAAWCSQNPESVAAFYSHQGSLRVNDGPPAVGRTAITQVAQSFMTAFPDLCVVMDDLRLQADEPEDHWTLLGWAAGPRKFMKNWHHGKGESGKVGGTVEKSRPCHCLIRSMRALRE